MKNWKEILLLPMVFSLAACSSTAVQEEETEIVPVASTETTEVQSMDESTDILVVYFSLAGEQYSVGIVEEGSTSIVANYIAETVNADIFPIEAVDAYPDSYDEKLERTSAERDENARPEIAGTVENWDVYDVVFIGYPIWWADLPMIVYNFLESYDFTGKTVIPFDTNAGSGLAGTVNTIESITQTEVKQGLGITGKTVQQDWESAKTEIDSWLEDLGY